MNSNRLVIIGGGGGSEDYIMPLAYKEIQNADFIVSSKRFEFLAEGKQFFKFSKTDETIELIENLLQKGNTAVIVSGDPLLYSFYRTVKNKFSNITVVPSISSIQLLASKFGITLENSEIISVHGRNISDGKIINAVKNNEYTFFLCSSENNPSYLAEKMIKYGFNDVNIYIGADLSYENEILDFGKSYEIISKDYPSLCVIAIENKNFCNQDDKILLNDSDFIRNSTPMTKEEVRAVILLKMKLENNMTVWDIGAGTGSISVECARLCRNGIVYAVEKNQNAYEIICKNKEKFMLNNLLVCKGNALEEIKNLTVPDTVFIGGSDGELKDIFRYICSFDKKIRVTVSAVTLETLSEAYEIMKEMPEFNMVQIAVNTSTSVGKYNILNGNNPVYIISCCTK